MIEYLYTSTNEEDDSITIQWQGWNGVWMAFASYALFIGIIFFICFKYKHNQHEVQLHSLPYSELELEH